MNHALTTIHALMGVGFLYVAIIADSKFFAVVLAISFFAAAIHNHMSTRS